MSLRAKAQLHFDSEQVDVHIGSRGATLQPRTLLYQNGDLCVDILVHGGGDDMSILHGQVIRTPSARAVAGVEVRLGDDALVTDEHGQFALTLMERRRGLELVVQAEDQEVVCEIPLLQGACCA